MVQVERVLARAIRASDQPGPPTSAGRSVLAGNPNVLGADRARAAVPAR